MQYPVLMVGDVRLINREVCSYSLQLKGVHLPKNAICSSSDSNVDSCHGDDGGMLVCADADRKWLLHGIIISHGCHGVDPTIYVNVSAYSDWIKKPDVPISSPIVG
ncbi:hypothetical protein CHS0354_038570 [Potamilus streckersoni]|uniref:Peptidase S1 domain-containing protein n=1 Tax=Potamilus streckersoni TaxID=2493646 RepID=A0AAE0VHW2_9BIVA|nr:hypothetical protein CHS0354_038570 [Potamilus streckersoni]